MKKKVIIFILIILVLGGGFVVVMNRGKSQQTTANVTMVKMVEAEEETLTTKVSADGTVTPEEDQGVKARLSGIVGQVFVDSGDMVEKGEKVFSLEDESLNNQLETAELNLEEVEGNYQDLLTTYRNQDQLNKLRLDESKRNLDIAVLSYQQEEASLEEQKLKLEEQLKESKKNLEKAEKKYNENKYLYERDAVPQNTLTESEEAYEQAESNYKRAQKDLNIFIEKTMPNSLNLAQLKIDNASNQLEYLKASIESEKITENDLEMARLKVTKAEKQIKEIKDSLNKVITYAPMSGIVIDFDIKSGDKIAEGTTVGTIADLDQFIVEAMVDEIDINEVKKGQEVIISSDSFDKNLEGIVNFIAPSGTQEGNINKYRTDVTINDDKGFLRPGMFVNTEIITNSSEGIIAVPSLAIMGDEEKYVFVAKDGKAEKRIVEVGLKSLSKVEISNVEAGEKIIIGPYTVLTNLQEGASVAQADNAVR
ncbi:MAG: efflux RND transporter periplasmic adaptor subunit [Bacillota bacterium]